MDTEKVKKNELSWKSLMVIVMIITLSAALALIIFRYRKANAVLPTDDSARIAVITKQLQASVVLPEGDAAIAHVVDTSKLTDPQLAVQAKNGDDLLVYAKAKRVILYRPSSRHIIDMFHITPPQTGATSGQMTQPAGQ